MWLRRQMEFELKKVFIIALILTLVLVRLFSGLLHDTENYSDDKTSNSEQIKTVTSLLRQTTGFDFHHIHIGVFLIILVLVLMIIGYINLASVTLLAIGTSLIADQLFPLLDLGNYFLWPMTLLAILLHAIIIEIVLLSDLALLKFSN